MSKKYIGIIHTWWVNSGNFLIFEIDAQSRQEAQTKLDARTLQSISQFRHAAGKLVVLEENQNMQRQTKLTWRERITGRINHG